MAPDSVSSCAQALEFPEIGHTLALMADEQADSNIETVRAFLTGS
jgi:hypothetical protein